LCDSEKRKDFAGVEGAPFFLDARGGVRKISAKHFYLLEDEIIHVVNVPREWGRARSSKKKN